MASYVAFVRTFRCTTETTISSWNVPETTHRNNPPSLKAINKQTKTNQDRNMHQPASIKSSNIDHCGDWEGIFPLCNVRSLNGKDKKAVMGD